MSPEADRALAALKAGGVIAIPTDTVMGLVCAFDDERAIRRIFAIKGRPETNPLPVLIAGRHQLSLLADRIPETAEKLFDAFWPGPLTTVLHAKPTVSALITAGTDKVGVRVPAHPLALAVVQAFGKPLASTSANLSGKPPALNAAEVRNQLSGLDFALDSDHPLSGQASTVLDLTRVPPVVLRQGSISVPELSSTVGIDVVP